jgi:hypothetical protein
MAWFRSKKTPSFLDEWKKDADGFGLPENVQKGLVFLIALKTRIDPNLQSPEKLLGRAKKFCDRVSLKRPDALEELGGDFYDGVIEHLLTELAERIDGTFESREVGLPGCEKIRVWARGEEDQLPACLNSETFLLSDWEEILTSLCGLIGDKIGDELDEAFIDGYHMFESRFCMDSSGTVQIIEAATSLFPPHFQWLDWCVEFDAEMIALGNPVNKVLQSFLASSHPMLTQAILLFSDHLHYSGPGEKRRDVWDASLPEFTLIAGSEVTGLCEQNAVEAIQSAREALGTEGFLSPPICSSSAEIASVLQAQVREKWGFDILADVEPLGLGAQYTRRACISLLCVANGILEPAWNQGS